MVVHVDPCRSRPPPPLRPATPPNPFPPPRDHDDNVLNSCTSGREVNDPMVGRVRALGLMIFSVVLAILGQYWLYDLFDEYGPWEDG